MDCWECDCSNNVILVHFRFFLFYSSTWFPVCRTPMWILVQSPKDRELLGLEWGMILQVSIVIFPDENSGVRCQYSKESHKIWCLTWHKRGWKFFEFFVKPVIVVGKYLEIFHLGEGESTVLMRTNWEMSLTFLP